MEYLDLIFMIWFVMFAGAAAVIAVCIVLALVACTLGLIVFWLFLWALRRWLVTEGCSDDTP